MCGSAFASSRHFSAVAVGTGRLAYNQTCPRTISGSTGHRCSTGQHLHVIALCVFVCIPNRDRVLSPPTQLPTSWTPECLQPRHHSPASGQETRPLALTLLHRTQVFDGATVAAPVPARSIPNMQQPDARDTFRRDTAATARSHERGGSVHPSVLPHTAMRAAHDPQHSRRGPSSTRRITAVQMPRYQHTLATFARGTGVTLLGVYNILSDVLAALRTGKEVGVAHGNLSVHTIHVNGEGRAVVGGFEAAHIAGVSARERFGNRMFLPRAALARGWRSVRELDPYAADMWALGFVLLHLLFPISLPALMSHRTFSEELARGRLPGVLLQLMDETPQFLLTTDVQRLAVATMVMRLTVRNPARRGTIEEMQQLVATGRAELVAMGRAEAGTWRVRDGLPGGLSDINAGEVMPWDVTWRTYDQIYSYMINGMVRPSSRVIWVVVCGCSRPTGLNAVRPLYGVSADFAA